MLKIKLFAVFAFLLTVAGVFLLAGGRSQAQTDKNNERRDETLEKVAGYKLWKQVQKPEKTSDVTVENPALTVFSTTIAA